MLFEENPWLLVPIIILVVETWNLAKAAVRRWLAARRGSGISERVDP